MVFRELTLDRVNRATTTLDGAAGKSVNVAKVLKALGGSPVATGFLGGDRGRTLESLLTSREIPSEFVNVQAPTRQCITVIDQATGAITELVEESRAVDPADYEKLLVIVQRRVASCQAIVMSGTIALGGPADLYFRCACLAHEAGALSIADASGPALVEVLKASPDVVKPNRVELAATVGRPLMDTGAVKAAILELRERGAQRVVVTAGADPTLAFDGAHFFQVTAPTVPVVNPIGSGDAFTAALVWQLVRGTRFDEACRWASAAGAANAITQMAGEVNFPDVERLLREVLIQEV
jgi:1-phosphofructokinase family hexose kinase